MECRLRIRAAPERALSAAQECEVLRAGVRDGAAPPGIRPRLALLLNQLDAFDDCIAVLRAAPDGSLSHDELLLLASAHLARGKDDDAGQALVAATAAATLAESDAGRALATVSQAKALRQMDRDDAATALLHEALAFDPANPDAFNLLTLDLLRRGEAKAVLAMIDTLRERGVDHSQLLATSVTALTSLGDHDAARALLGLDTFLHQEIIATPSGWDSLEAFNAALAHELLANPARRYERYGTASVQSWRIDSLVAGEGPLARLLVRELVETVQRYADTLADMDHRWIAAAPRDAELHSWCVITEGSGYERWHLHPYGWMSGVYYVNVPPQVGTGTTEDGCLIVGVADTLVPTEAAREVGFHLVRPRPGLLALFPSHCYHRTFAHQAEGKRICVAFDIRPC
jgi:Flp pilus assembly protein TadD